MLTRMITEATPMMIPSMVRKERILFPQILFKAILNDCSIFFHIPIKIDPAVYDPHLSLIHIFIETGVGIVLRKKMSHLGELFIFKSKKKK